MFQNKTQYVFINSPWYFFFFRIAAAAAAAASDDDDDYDDNDDNDDVGMINVGAESGTCSTSYRLPEIVLMVRIQLFSCPRSRSRMVLRPEIQLEVGVE